MAVSDATILIVIAQIALYVIMYRNKTRLYRLVGCAGMIAVGLSAVMIEDSVPAFIFAGVSIIIACFQLFEDVTEMWHN